MHRALTRASFLAGLCAACAAGGRNGGGLGYEVYTSGPRGYFVTSTILYGPTEAVVIDAQFLQSDAARLADRIEALGRRLKAVLVTHPDADHYMGLATLHARFPDARLLMRPDAIPGFEAGVPRYLSMMGRAMPDEAPQSVPTPEALNELVLRVDGQRIEIMAGLQGDFHERPANSVVLLPDQRAMFVSDLAFEDVHLWLEGSTSESRARWRADLARLAAMNPSIVVAGHRANAAAPFSPHVLGETRRYLEEFDRLLAANDGPDAFIADMTARYPNYALPLFLTLAARSQYAPATPPG